MSVEKPLIGKRVYDEVLLAYQSMLAMPHSMEPRLHGVISDALANPGSLTRAQLAFELMMATGAERVDALRIATAIEYFHTASLLLDDLPCMDDALERRNRICPHRRYGEAAAILGALAFINRGYALIWQVLASLPENRSRIAAHLVDDCLGAAGILNGQSKDVHFSSQSGDSRTVTQIALEKTVSLVRLSLVLPALICGVAGADLEVLEALSRDWGLAYQALDDFKDVWESPDESGKTPGRDSALGRPNLLLCEGFEDAFQRLAALLESGADHLQFLLTSRPSWSFLNRLAEHLDEQALQQYSKAMAA